MRNSRGSDRGNQSGGRVEGRGQATGERLVYLTVGRSNVGAPAATRVLMALETVCDFLERRVSGARPARKFVATYSDNASDELSEIRGINAGETANVAFASVDSSIELGDDVAGALVVGTAVELWNDSVELVAEGREFILHGGPIRNHPRDGDGDGAGEGGGTGSDDDDDGRETHGEEA